MSRASKRQLAQLERDNERWSSVLTEIPESAWPESKARMPMMFKVLRSKEFLVQLHRVGDGLIRMSVNRTKHSGKDWADGISWDDLQRLKREAGYGECDAAEIYPRDIDVVNVASLRHLWVWTDKLIPFAWRNKSS